ncbi:MAG: hypothetical protein J6C90_03045, partial [Clostridia bacterium]|nr:hypothetical protein [Clostridia bacterium]
KNTNEEDNFFDDNVWVQQRYLGTNEYIKGRKSYSTPMQDNPMQTLNYGYPLLDLGTKKFNAAGLFEPTYVAKYTGNGTATDPVQIINLGTLDYMRSLGTNGHISHFELTRDIYTTHNSGYMLTYDWDIKITDDKPSSTYYGESSFKKVLSGGEITNPRTISGLIGGALLNSIEGGNGNTEEGTGDTITNGIVQNLRMTNSYTETGIVAGTLTTGLVTGVYIEGENQAKAGIVGTMQLGARVNNCLLSGTIESSTNGDVSGVCHQMDSNQDVIANVLLNDLILVGNQNVNGVINTMKAGQVYGMSGRVALQGVSNTNIGGIAGTMSGGTIGISDGEEGLGSTGNQLIIVSQSGAQVGGITRILQDGSIRGNSIQFAFSGTIDTSLVGGLVAEAQKGLVQSNTIYFNMANSSAVQSFGGLVGKAGTGEINVTDNAVSGKAMLSGSVNKVGGLMSTIDQDGMNIIFTSNKITATIQNDASFIDSVGGTGGFFGTIQNSYDFNKTTAEGEETNGNEFTGIVQGVTNVGGQVGYYNAKYDIKSFLVENQVGNVIGSQNVGGVVGYLDLTKTVGATPAVTEDGDVATNAPLTLEGLTNNNNVQAKLLGTVRESKNVGGIFGYINENALYSPTVVTPLTITDMINRGDVASNGESYQTNFVGGIIGKLGAELEYAEDIQASVDVMDVYTYDYTLTNNTNFGSVGGRYFVGGIIGVIASKANRIELASNTNGYDNSSNVRGAGAVGGIAGYLYVPSDQTLEAQEDKLYIRDLVNNSDLNISDRDKASYFGGIVGTIYSTGRVLVSSGTNDEESCNFSGLVNNGSLTGHNYVVGLFGKIVSHSGSVSGFEDINIGDGSTSITGNEYVGGIMGYYKMDKNISLEVFKITNIHNNANITGNKYAGGLFGHLDLTRTYTIPGEQTTEAVYNAGNAKVRTEISNITNNGKVSGIGNSADSGFIGGVIGHLDASKMVVDINNVNNAGSINGYGNYVGGIFGRADLNDETIGFERPAVDEDGNDTTEIEEHKTSVKSLTNSGTFGTDAGGANVSHNMGNYVGGIIGYLQYADATPNDGKTDIVSETIYDVYNAGHVKGNTHVGGIFGYADNFELHGRRAIKDAEGNTTYDKAVYSNTGSVTGVTNVGGIIGSTKYDILGLGEDTKTIELFEKTAVKINADDDYKGSLIAN